MQAWSEGGRHWGYNGSHHSEHQEEGTLSSIVLLTNHIDALQPRRRMITSGDEDDADAAAGAAAGRGEDEPGNEDEAGSEDDEDTSDIRREKAAERSKKALAVSIISFHSYF